MKQGPLAIVKNTSQLAVDQQGVNWPAARNSVIDLVVDTRTVRFGFKSMFVVPPAIRSPKLLVDEAVRRVPNTNL